MSLLLIESQRSREPFTLNDAGASTVTDFIVDLQVFAVAPRPKPGGYDVPPGIVWNRMIPRSFYNLIGFTLQTSVNSGSTTVILTHSSSENLRSIPKVGSFLIGPGTANEHWDMIYYKDVAVYEHSGTATAHLEGVEWAGRGISTHTAGATVTLAYDITDKLVSPVSLSSAQNSAWYSWEATMDFAGGIDRYLLERDNGILVMRREYYRQSSGNPTWSPWRVMLFGYIREGSGRMDYKLEDKITVTVAPLSQYLRSTTCEPVATGNPNIAIGKTVSASSTLSDPLLDTDGEDWIGAAPPSVAPDNVVDGNLNTLWISDGEPNSLFWEPVGQMALSLEEVFSYPWTGYSDGLQWMVIYSHLWGDTITISTSEGYSIVTNVEAFRQIDEYEGYVCLCSNRTLFDRYFDPGDMPVIEWSNLRDSEGRKVPFRLPKERGWVQVYESWSADVDAVVYGSGVNTSGMYNVVRNVWNSTGYMPAMQPGVSIRRSPPRGKCVKQYFGMPKCGYPWGPAWFTMEPIVNPGSRARPDDADSFVGEWINIDLGSPGLSLGQSLTGGRFDPPDGMIEIRRGEAVTTDGLLNSGIIQVGLEQISYTGRTATHLTGVTRSNPVAHSIGERVYQVVNGVAVDGYPISTVSVRRRSGLQPAIFAGRIYTTCIANPRRPVAGENDDSWLEDWDKPPIVIVSPDKATAPTMPDSPRWARHVMVLVDQMCYKLGEVAETAPVGATTLRVYPDRWLSKIDPNNGWIWVDDRAYEYSAINAETGVITLKPTVGSLPNGPFARVPITAPINAGAQVFKLGGRAKVNEIEVNRWMISIHGETEIPCEAPALIRYLLTERFGMEERLIQLPDSGAYPIADMYTSRGTYYQIIDELARRYALVVIENPDCTICVRADPWHPQAANDATHKVWSNNNSIMLTHAEPFRHDVSQVEMLIVDPAARESKRVKYPKVQARYGSVTRIEDAVGPIGTAIMRASREYRKATCKDRYTIIPVGIVNDVWGQQIHRVAWPSRNAYGLVTGASWRIGWESGKNIYDCSIELTEFI